MFTPAEVLPFLTHDDPLVRQLAYYYFADSHDPAPATARDGLRAACLVTEDLSPGRSLIAAFPATPACIPALLEDLALPDNPRAEHIRQAFMNLAYPVLNATAPTILASRDVAPPIREFLELRLQLQQESSDALWNQFLDLCIREDELDDDEEDFYSPRRAEISDQAKALRTALALHPGEIAPRVMAILADKSIEDWREIHAVEVAGDLKLSPAIPLLIDRLALDADLLRERVVDALTAIGTAEVVTRLAAFIPAQEWHVRLYSDDPLIRIKRPESEDALLALLEKEEMTDLRTDLAGGLCRLISDRGFELVRHMVVEGHFDRTHLELDEDLCGLALMLGRTFPEADKLRRKIAQRERQRRERFGNLDKATLLAQFAEAMAQRRFMEEQTVEPEDLADLAPPREQPAIRVPRVGRNDPCPCGSGKKYKKCCLGKTPEL